MRIRIPAARLAVAMFLAAILVLSGCSGAPGMPASANLSLAAAAAASPGEKADLLQYLKTAQKDLAVIDTVLADADLGLLDDSDSSSNEEFTAEQAAKYQELLDNYSSQVKETLDSIKTRVTPNHPDIAKFKAAETAELNTAESVLEEYLQILDYYGAMLNMNDDISQLGNVDTNDLEGTYKAYSESIQKAIKELQDNNTPSCLKSMNDNLIGALQEMDDAVLYSLNAVALNDPVRQDAAQYRMEILTRKVNSISTGLQQDLTDRQKKLVADMKGVQTENTGLKNWVQSNIDLLGKN